MSYHFFSWASPGNYASFRFSNCDNHHEFLINSNRKTMHLTKTLKFSHHNSLKHRFLEKWLLIDWLIFNSMSICLGLIYAKKLQNPTHCSYLQFSVIVSHEFLEF